MIIIIPYVISLVLKLEHSHLLFYAFELRLYRPNKANVDGNDEKKSKYRIYRCNDLMLNQSMHTQTHHIFHIILSLSLSLYRSFFCDLL